MIRTKYLFLHWGYDIATDCPFSLTIGLGHRAGPGCNYRLVFGCYFDWPKIIWRHREWAVNEPGYLRGVPVRRAVMLRRFLWINREYNIAGIYWFRMWTFRHHGRTDNKSAGD